MLLCLILNMLLLIPEMQTCPRIMRSLCSASSSLRASASLLCSSVCRFVPLEPFSRARCSSRSVRLTRRCASYRENSARSLTIGTENSGVSD